MCNYRGQPTRPKNPPVVLHALGFVALHIVAVVHVLSPYVLPHSGRLVVEVGDAALQFLVAKQKLRLQQHRRRTGYGDVAGAVGATLGVGLLRLLELP